MDNKLFLEKKQEIITKYKKIHKIIFGYGIFFVIIILAWSKAYTIISSIDETTESENPLQLQKEAKIKEFYKHIENTNTTLSGPITLGQIEETNDYISSFNNIVYYKGFITPRTFGVYKNAPLKDINYFSGTNYTVDEIDLLFKNIFVGNTAKSIQNSKKTSFPLQKGVIEDFSLQCLFQKKLSNNVCNIFVDTFLDDFFVYSIETDIENFSKVITEIAKQKKYQEKTCQQLLHHTYYIERENTTIENLLTQCPQNYQDQYRIFIDFQEVQKELSSKLISEKIYKNEVVNTYKLVSFQQIIYSDINNKIISSDRLNGYFGFIQELLKKNKIGLFYKELTYFFNNYYLKTAIENTETANKSDVDKISKQIIAINNGNELVGYHGLKDQIINKNLFKKETTVEETINNENYNQKIENLLKQIKDIEIKQQFLSGNNILIYGIRQIEIGKNQQNQTPKIVTIATKLRLEENNNTLTLKQIMLEKYEEIAQTINKLLEKQDRTFADLQKYIQQNIFLFTTPQPTNNEEIQKICTELSEKLTDQEIKICNNNKIDIDLLRNNKVITMTISHDNFLLKKIDISDEEAKKQLQIYLQNPAIANQINYNKINKSDFVSFLQKTITEFLTFKVQTQEKFEGSANTIIIVERVKKYLGIPVNDIVEKNDKILIDFTIANIPLLGYYNIQEHKISPLYFKEANSTKTPILIKNTSIILSDEEKESLNTFLLQPLEIIKKNSPEEYLLYQKYLSEKNKTF